MYSEKEHPECKQPCGTSGTASRLSQCPRTAFRVEIGTPRINPSSTASPMRNEQKSLSLLGRLSRRLHTLFSRLPKDELLFCLQALYNDRSKKRRHRNLYRLEASIPPCLAQSSHRHQQRECSHLWQYRFLYSVLLIILYCFDESLGDGDRSQHTHHKSFLIHPWRRHPQSRFQDPDTSDQPHYPNTSGDTALRCRPG